MMKASLRGLFKYGRNSIRAKNKGCKCHVHQQPLDVDDTLGVYYSFKTARTAQPIGQGSPSGGRTPLHCNLPPHPQPNSLVCHMALRSRNNNHCRCFHWHQNNNVFVFQVSASHPWSPLNNQGRWHPRCSMPTWDHSPKAAPKAHPPAGRR